MNSSDPMTPNGLGDPVEWVRRVNRTWIVHQGQAERAEGWLAYLEGLPDGRFEESGAAAHAMSHRRDHAEDPKPWFYAGLFSTATAAEAQRFPANHRLTPATVPAMCSCFSSTARWRRKPPGACHSGSSGWPPVSTGRSTGRWLPCPPKSVVMCRFSKSANHAMTMFASWPSRPAMAALPTRGDPGLLRDFPPCVIGNAERQPGP